MKIATHTERRWHSKLLDSPTEKVFCDVWDELRRDRYMDNAASDLLRHKKRLVGDCFAEGCRVEYRSFLGTATCITLSQDAASMMHLARFLATNPSLECLRAVLGMVRDGSTSHKQILRMTDQIIREFCASYFGAPDSPLKTPLVSNEELYQWVRSHVRVWDSDNAR